MIQPYRLDGRGPFVRQAPIRGWKRPWCWIVGHTWYITRDIGADLAHIHPLAGCDAHCLRCGAVWRDYDGILAMRRRMFRNLVPDDETTQPSSNATERK